MLDEPVFLLGMPRSGTTWLSQIFESHPRFVVRLSPMYSYELKNSLDVASDAEQWRAVLARAVDTSDPFMTQDWQRSAGNLPRVEHGSGVRLAIKDTRFHDVYIAGMDRLPRARAVVIIRNPAATLDSWRRSPEFPEDADFLEQWRSGECRRSEGPGEYWGFDDWVRLTRRYRALAAMQPDRFLILRFERLVTDPETQLAEVFAFVGEQLDPSVIRFVRASHSRHADGPYSVYKDPSLVVDAWRARLPPSIVDEIHSELAGTPLEEYLQ